jgi:2-dehydropantoate 2-reductase
MKTGIVGAGAVGLALGSCLHEVGQPPLFVIRGGTEPHPLETHGLRRTGLFGEVAVAPEELKVCRSIGDLVKHELDFLLICTKTTASAALARELGAIWSELPRKPLLVICQNGWGTAELFAEKVPRDRIANARIITGFRRSGGHCVEVTVHADAIHVGSLFDSETEDISQLCSAISRGGIPCKPSTRIEADLWAKLLYNCLLNPLGALANVPYGRLGEEAETRALMENLAREIFDVLRASGFETHWPNADRYLESFYGELLPATAAHESSMLQDVRAGRRTEIDALCGAVVKLGQRHGVPTPVNHALTVLIRATALGPGNSRSRAS